MIHHGTPTVHYSGIYFSSSLSHSTYQKGINTTIRAWGFKKKGKLAKSQCWQWGVFTIESKGGDGSTIIYWPRRSDWPQQI